MYFLREFVSANERYPESGRAVSRLRTGIADSVSAESAESGERGGSGEHSPIGLCVFGDNTFQPPPDELSSDAKRDKGLTIAWARISSRPVRFGA